MGLAKMLSEEDGSKQSHENEKNSYCDLQYIYIYSLILILILFIYLLLNLFWDF